MLVREKLSWALVRALLLRGGDLREGPEHVGLVLLGLVRPSAPCFARSGGAVLAVARVIGGKLVFGHLLHELLLEASIHFVELAGKLADLASSRAPKEGGAEAEALLGSLALFPLVGLTFFAHVC